MWKTKTLAKLLVFVIFFPGCATSKKAIDFKEKEISIANTQYWTEEASAVNLANVGFKRDRRPRSFQKQRTIILSEDDIVVRANVVQDVEVESLINLDSGYTRDKIATVAGKAKRDLNKVEKFKIIVLSIRNDNIIKDSLRNDPSLTKHLIVDEFSRAITAIAIIFDHESTQTKDIEGELRAKLSKVDGSPNVKLEYSDKERTETYHANGTIVAYEMMQFCWDEDTKEPLFLIKDLRMESEQKECPGNTVPYFAQEK